MVPKKAPISPPYISDHHSERGVPTSRTLIPQQSSCLCVVPFATRCPISMIPPSRSSRFLDWCETLLVAGYDDAPGLILNAIAIVAMTIFYDGSVGWALFKRDIK